MRWRVAICVLLSLVSGIALLAHGDVLHRWGPRVDVQVQPDVAYGDHHRQRFDLYLPVGEQPAGPLIVFFPGGGWQGGTKEAARFVGEGLAADRFVVAIANYRVYPDVVFPAFLQDAAMAVRHAHAMLARSDNRKLVLMGHSAGAQIALMLALDRSWLNRAGLDPQTQISAVVGIAGPYDEIPLEPNVRAAIFGPDAGLGRALPITFVHAGAPPILAIAGSCDDTVAPENVTRLRARLREVGAPGDGRTYFGLGHVSVLNALAYPLRLITPVHADIVDFIRWHARP
jgi:acetyl esterase/lipase